MTDDTLGKARPVPATGPPAVGWRKTPSRPLYPRLLRLRHVHPSAWQRALLVEGVLVVGSLVALADKVTAWAPLILLVAVAAVVKFHDVLTGVLGADARAAAGTADAEHAATPSPATEDDALARRSRERAVVDGVPAVRVLSAPVVTPSRDEAAESRREQAAAVKAEQRAEREAAALLAAATAEIDLVEAEATELAQNLLLLDGEVHPFALCLLADGLVTLVNAEGAYDRVPEAERISTLRAELRRSARDPQVSAVAIAHSHVSGVRIEIEHRRAEPRVATLPFTEAGSALGAAQRATGTPTVLVWG